MNIRNTKRQMSRTKIYKKYLLHNEKERNLKIIDIVVDPCQRFDSCKDFIDPRHPLQSFDPLQDIFRHQKFIHITQTPFESMYL